MEIEELLRVATIEKEKENYELACVYLKEAYLKALQSPICYPVEVYLRLPNYLQMAGKQKEAWEAFEHLIKTGYPSQPTAPGLRKFDLATIFDKMRLFLQREKQGREAVAYGIGAYVLKREAFADQNRQKEVAFEDSVAGKSNLIKIITAKQAFGIDKEKLDVELKGLVTKELGSRPDELIKTVKELSSRCLKDTQPRVEFDENGLKDQIKAQWHLIPDSKAFKKAVTLYRKLIQGKSKLKRSVADDVKDLYKTAVLYELLFETNLVKPTIKVKGIMPAGHKHVAYAIAQSLNCQELYRKIDPDYRSIGYKKLTLLNEKDTVIIGQAFGEPIAHITPRIFFKDTWFEIVQKFEDRIKADYKSFEAGFNKIMKQWG